MFRVKSKDALFYLTLGSILPDIDPPQSTIGRVFFFISNPLNKMCGHRNFTHSLVLWIAVLIIGHHFYKPLFWLEIGACSHLLLDTWNLSGVTLFKPLTDRIFVMAGLKYRVKVGSKNELAIMFILALMVWGSFNLAELGGFRGMVRELIGDYNIAYNEHQKQGTKVCYLEDKLRMNNGVL
nr:metal-dependent hydrolase [Orenia metallireducens]